MQDNNQIFSESGSPYWTIGYAPMIPYVGEIVQIVAAITLVKMTRQHPSSRVRENARWSANWNLTVVSVVTLLVCLSFVFAIAEFGFLIDGMFNVVIGCVIAAMIVRVVHVIVTTVGVLRADTQVFRPRLAIPFFR